MPLPNQSYTWPRVESAVAAWVERCTGLPRNCANPTLDPPAQIVWSHYDTGPIELGFVSLQRLTQESIGTPTINVREAATEQRITVTQTTEGERVSLWLAWSEQGVVVQVGATITDTRDALLAALVAGVDETREPFAFAADGADGILVSPKGSWVVDLVALIGCTISDVSTELVRVRSQTKRYLIRVQLYGFDGTGDEAIDEYADALVDSLHDASPDGALAFLGLYGVGIDGSPPVVTDLSALSGALQERRCFFDVPVVTVAVTYYRDAVPIDATDPPTLVGIFG